MTLDPARLAGDLALLIEEGERGTLQQRGWGQLMLLSELLEKATGHAVAARVAASTELIEEVEASIEEPEE